jgi:Flp pilus assembly pilin Flp
MFTRSFTLRLHRDQRGLTTVEYAIVLCLIAAASVGLWNDLGEMLHTKLGDANGAIDESVQIEFD